MNTIRNLQKSSKNKGISAMFLHTCLCIFMFAYTNIGYKISHNVDKTNTVRCMVFPILNVFCIKFALTLNSFEPYYISLIKLHIYTDQNYRINQRI